MDWQGGRLDNCVSMDTHKGNPLYVYIIDSFILYVYCMYKLWNAQPYERVLQCATCADEWGEVLMELNEF